MVVVAVALAVIGSSICALCWIAERCRVPEVVRHVRTWTRAQESYKNVTNATSNER